MEFVEKQTETENGLLVEKMKNELADLLKEQPELNTTYHIMRFLRARDFKFEPAKLMFKNYLEFRKQKDLTRIANIDMNSERIKAFKDYYISGHYGFDYEGRLIIIERVGCYNTKAITKEFTISDLEDFMIQLQERILFVEFPVLSEIFKRKIDKSVVILDLKNLRIKSLFKKDFKLFMQTVLKLTSDYYPETLGKSIFINAPFGSEFAWKIIKMWMDPKIADKFDMNTDNGKKALSKIMDYSKLPKEIGGENNVSLSYGYGPFIDEIRKSHAQKTIFLTDRAIEYRWFYTSEERQLIQKETPSTINSTQKDFHKNKSLNNIANNSKSIIDSSFRSIKPTIKKIRESPSLRIFDFSSSRKQD